jgi:hypothetical protein
VLGHVPQTLERPRVPVLLLDVARRVQIIATVRSTRRLTDELGAILPPLVRRADGTLDAVNAEIERVDGVVSQFEEVSENVVATTRAASDIAGAPAAAVAGIAARARTFFGILLGRRV